MGRSALAAAVLVPLAASAQIAQLAAVGARCEAMSKTSVHCTRRFEALGRDEEFALHMPLKAPRTTVVFLHGLGRNCRSLFQFPETRQAIEDSPTAILFPNGRKSWWVDSAEEGKYQSYVLELLRVVSAALHWPERRGIGGWSMGGYGSLRLMVDHPELFEAWAGILAVTDFPNGGYPKDQNHSVPELFGPPAGWERWNPLTEAVKLRGKRLRFSTGDTAFDRQMNETLDRTLERFGIAHQFTILPGGHEIKVVIEEVPKALRFLEIP